MEKEVMSILLKFYRKSVAEKKLVVHKKRTSTYKYNLFNLLEKYDYNAVFEIFKEYVNNRRFIGTLPYYVKKYGKIEGEVKYIAKNKRLSVGYESLKLNGKTDDEIKKIKEKHAEKSDCKSLNYFTEKI